MRSYFALRQADGDSHMVISDYEVGSFETLSLKIGLPLSGPLPGSVRLYVRADGAWSDCLESALFWLVCSQALMNVLQKNANGGLQVFDAPMWDTESRERVEGFTIVNITRLVDCLDAGRSAFTVCMQRSDAVRITEYALHLDKIHDDARVFRLIHHPYSIIVSEEVRAQILHESLRGIELVECIPSPED